MTSLHVVDAATVACSTLNLMCSLIGLTSLANLVTPAMTFPFTRDGSTRICHLARGPLFRSTASAILRRDMSLSPAIPSLSYWTTYEPQKPGGYGLLSSAK